jgi:hypothetical protein
MEQELSPKRFTLSFTLAVTCRGRLSLRRRNLLGSGRYAGQSRFRRRPYSVSPTRIPGLKGRSSRTLMKEAGLTVGGFYKHFKSRDALVIEAIGSALEIWKDRIDPAAAGGTDRAIRRIPCMLHPRRLRYSEARVGSCQLWPPFEFPRACSRRSPPCLQGRQLD